MEKKWSNKWNSSTQRRKQRKYLFNAPLHIKRKLINASLSKELRKEYSTRSIPVRKGDTVKIISGGFKDVSGKVTKVSLARTFIHVEGATVKRADGTESLYPIHPSNVVIVKLELNDKQRVQKIERLKKENGKQ